MKETLVKYIFILVITLVVVVPTTVFLTGISGCVGIKYKESTPSVKCNLALMLIKLKSMKGNEAFEVRDFVKECYRDLDVIKCRNRIYGDKPIDDSKNKKLEFLQCLEE